MIGVDLPLRLLKTVAKVSGLSGRQVWAGPGRYHIELHGLDDPNARRLIAIVERGLESQRGVLWARVNAPSRRVVVAVGSPPPDQRDLVHIVELAERYAKVHADEDDDACLDLHHPCEGPRTPRAVSALAADAVGLGLSALTRLSHWVPLPTEVAALGATFQHHPKLHALAGKGMRSQHDADSVLPVASALAQGLAAGGEGIVLDGTQRIAEWREARAHQAAWKKAEPELVSGPEHAAADPVVQRPSPPPADPVDAYAERAMGIGAIGGLASMPFFGPRRGVALALTSLPKAPSAGRQGFATSFGRILAQRGVIVMDRGVLRRLGYLDTVVLDAGSLNTGRYELTNLIPRAGADPTGVAEAAYSLFKPSEPDRLVEEDGWVLGPLERLELSGTTGKQAAAKLRKQGAEHVIGLARGRRLRAVAGVTAQQSEGMQAMAAAARRSGAAVVVATDSEQRRFTYADSVVSPSRLTEAVHELQSDGATVLVVSGDRRALGAADCGVGLYREGEPPTWGAHILAGPDVEAAAMVVEAIATAAAVDDQSMKLAAGGSGVGAVAALQARGPQVASAGLLPVNAAAAVAFAGGRWRARKLLSRPITPPVSSTPWHLMPASVVLDRLTADPGGLTQDEAVRRARAEQNGHSPAGISLWQAFVDELDNPLTPVLAAGAALAAATGSAIDAGLVAAVTGASALMGGVQRLKTDRALSELLRESAVGATVRRDGNERLVAAADLVPGDVVRLGYSDVVPADCRILEANDLEADESSLTGESLPVAKSEAPVAAAEISERTSMLYEGTTIAAGTAVGVVVATGAATEAGRGMATARQAAPGEGAESRLNELTAKGMPLAIGAGAAVAGAGMLRGIPPRETLGAAVNLAVASVPEGLPFVLNAAQLAAARRLADQGALVRNPRTIEALGRADVLCFDKTGTLTEGKLRLVSVGDVEENVSLENLDRARRDVLAAALRATPSARSREELEHQTDRAVMTGARKARVGVRAGARSWRRHADLPFEPSRGYHATLGTNGHGRLLSVKGAPEVVLPRCSRVRTGGKPTDLGERGRTELLRKFEELASSGNRVLAVAERTVDEGGLDDDAVADLEFRGFVALADPVRNSAAPAAEELRAAGVQIVMLTGDHPATADAIAATVNGGSDQNVITGPELAELDDDELAERLAGVDVIARCSPSDKVRVIKAYQARGRTVAMTGDGANDAPAIRLADVGIALGSRGTPAARSAADLVVTDDQLATITAALLEGRAMWSSVREALAILLGGNLGEVSFSVLAALLTGRSPLTARQILLVNLLTDLAPALAIALREPKNDTVEQLLEEGPKASLGSQLDRDIMLRAAVTTLGASTAWGLARLTGRGRRAGTVALAALVGTQLGQTLAIGGLDRRVLAASIGSALALGAVIQTPGVSGFFGCTPLGPVGWSIALGTTTSATLVGVLASRVLPALR